MQFHNAVLLLACILALATPSHAYWASCGGRRVVGEGTGYRTTVNSVKDAAKNCQSFVSIQLAEEEAAEFDQSVSQGQSLTPCDPANPNMRCTGNSGGLVVDQMCQQQGSCIIQCLQSNPRGFGPAQVQLYYSNVFCMQQAMYSAGLMNVSPRGGRAPAIVYQAQDVVSYMQSLPTTYSTPRGAVQTGPRGGFGR